MKYNHTVKFANSDLPKFQLPIFPTIRYNFEMEKNILIGSIIRVEHTDIHNIYRAELIGKRVCMIKEIPTKFLLYDTNTDTREEAIEKLNGYYEDEITEGTIVHIIWLKKV